MDIPCDIFPIEIKSQVETEMKITTFLIAFFMLASGVKAQNTQEERYRNFPIIVTLQFHALTLPFHDFKTNFSNVGIGIGTEVSLNGKDNWAQQFSLIWIRNKQVGNGILLYTQSLWRPVLSSNTFTELKLGAGYLFAKRPVDSYKQIDGEWISAGKKGKGMFTIPAGISFGYSDNSANTYLSPFASYQVLLLKGYNQSIPIVPETLIQTGLRIRPTYHP